MPTADLHTDCRRCWFEVAFPCIVVINGRSCTALENPFLPLSQLEQASDEFRMPIVVGVERHVDLLILLQFLNSASANDASKVQYTWSSRSWGCNGATSSLRRPSSAVSNAKVSSG